MSPYTDLTREKFKEILDVFTNSPTRENLDDIIADLKGVGSEFFTGDGGDDAKASLQSLIENKDDMSDLGIKGELLYILFVIKGRVDELLPAEGGGRRRKTRSRRRPLGRRGRKSLRKSLRQRK